MSELANDDVKTLITSFHPKSHNALVAIFDHGLEGYMRWYPWRWFSDLVFLGAGGFSAVYGSDVILPYDAPEKGKRFGTQRRAVALKIVDDKILNEVRHFSENTSRLVLLNFLLNRLLCNQKHLLPYYSTA